MAQIGTFTRGEDGSYTGTIKTLSLNIKVRLVPAERVAEREGARPARAGRQYRNRCSLEADLEGEHRVSLGEARRPVLPGTDLRQPRRGRRPSRARLVALIRPRPGPRPAGAAALLARNYAERGDLQKPEKLPSRTTTPHNAQLRIISTADEDAVARSVVGRAAALRDDADVLGLDLRVTISPTNSCCRTS